MKRKMKRATQLTLFTTVLVTLILFVLLIFLVSDINNMLGETDLFTLAQLELYHLIIPPVLVLIIYGVSSLIIDNIFAPIREITAKITKINAANVSEPISIDEGDDELRDLVFAFNTMAGQLGHYIDMQKRFVSDASHEMATPITIINGHADMLLRRFANEETAPSLKIIKSEIQHMNDLVGSLLMLARNDSGRQEYNFESADLAEIVAEILTETKITAPDFEVESKLDPVQVRADVYAIQRVVRIIISNAVKYSTTVKKLEISTTVTQGMAELKIKDSGIGIANEHLNKIFDRFYRVDPARSRATGSSGLGLAIAKEIIKAHGGMISAESSVDEGTTFTLWLQA